MLKNKFSKMITLTSIMTLTTTKFAYAAGGSGDVVANINSWGNSFVDIVLAILKWGGIVSFILLAIGLLMNNDETAGKRMKIGMAITIAALFIGWFAQPIYGTFVK
jgi:hypothetical protein